MQILKNLQQWYAYVSIKNIAPLEIRYDGNSNLAWDGWMCGGVVTLFVVAEVL